jgi:hypothetical protein
MSKKEIIFSEASQEMIPDTLRADGYYAGNDEFVQREFELKKEIADYAKEFEPWQVEVARRYANGEPFTAIAQSLKKSPTTVSKAVKEPALEKLVHFFLHLRIYQDGPNDLLRRNMLWRIAVKNETTDPKEATKALAELNRMAQGNRGGGGFNIVINGVNLQKGPLDVK